MLEPAGFAMHPIMPCRYTQGEDASWANQLSLWEYLGIALFQTFGGISFMVLGHVLKRIRTKASSASRQKRPTRSVTCGQRVPTWFLPPKIMRCLTTQRAHEYDVLLFRLAAELITSREPIHTSQEEFSFDLSYVVLSNPSNLRDTCVWICSFASAMYDLNASGRIYCGGPKSLEGLTQICCACFIVLSLQKRLSVCTNDQFGVDS